MPVNAIDLVTLSDLKLWMSIGPGASPSDTILQEMITSASAFWLWRTGRAPIGQVPVTSPFVTPVSYNDTFDGNGNVQLVARNTPIKSIQSLTINGQNIPVSTGFPVNGYQFDDTGKVITLTGYTFCRGFQNIKLQSTAGFDAVPFDVAEKCKQMIKTTYERFPRPDHASEALPAGGGTISYRNWAIEPAVEQVLKMYTRRSLT